MRTVATRITCKILHNISSYREKISSDCITDKSVELNCNISLVVTILASEILLKAQLPSEV